MKLLTRPLIVAATLTLSSICSAQSDTLDFATVNSFSITNSTRNDTLEVASLSQSEVTTLFGAPTSEVHNYEPTGEFVDYYCYNSSCIAFIESSLGYIKSNSGDIVFVAYGEFDFKVGDSIEDLKLVFPHAFDDSYTTPDYTTDHHVMIAFFQDIT